MSALAPLRDALEQITAILAAAPADEMRRAHAAALFGRKLQPTSDAQTAPLREPGA